MKFERYMSLKRLGVKEVEGIEKGKVYIFPKLDGTNGSIWMDSEGEVQAGSRNRHLDETSTGDNAGFCKWVRKQDNIIMFMCLNPHLRLFGEWLVPHSLRTYREDAWKEFYVFDVYDHKQERFLSYEEYKELLSGFSINYIPVLEIIENPTKEDILRLLQENTYLVEEGIGEGIVLKNYNFVNRYGLVVWAKVISDEFYERKGEKPKVIKFPVDDAIERQIVEEYFTEAFINKEYNKMLLEYQNFGREFTKKDIGELMNRLFLELLSEEIIHFVPALKNPIINFKVLKSICAVKIKHTLTEVFKK